jgi:hypothetical protein
MPTRTTVTAKDVTTTTTTVKNDSTGQTVSQNTSTSSVSTPVKNPTSPGTAETQRTGQCDPTAKNYQECVGLLTSVTDTKQQELVDGLKTETNTALTTSTDAVNTSINGTSTGLGTNTTSIRNLANSVLYSSSTCSPMSIQIGPLTKTLTCEKFTFFKSLLGWFLYAFTMFYLIHLFFKPVER